VGSKKYLSGCRKHVRNLVACYYRHKKLREENVTSKERFFIFVTFLSVSEPCGFMTGTNNSCFRKHTLRKKTSECKSILESH
jgi:hypothetical protein